jgi:dipeptidyl aminopeptidase/acylaminoacyl peptidase
VVRHYLVGRPTLISGLDITVRPTSILRTGPTRRTWFFRGKYLDRLIGPLPEAAALYRERSPINYTDQLSCPVILFQGLEDRIVPPNQAELLFEALKRKGIPCAYVPFAGEQHGFRIAANIRRSLDGELYFYSRVLHFPLAEALEPVDIENLS